MPAAITTHLSIDFSPASHSYDRQHCITHIVAVLPGVMQHYITLPGNTRRHSDQVLQVKRSMAESGFEGETEGRTEPIWIRRKKGGRMMSDAK